MNESIEVEPILSVNQENIKTDKAFPINSRNCLNCLFLVIENFLSGDQINMQESNLSKIYNKH